MNDPSPGEQTLVVQTIGRTRQLLPGDDRARVPDRRSRSQGGRRVFFYGCSTFQRKGRCICDNNLTVPMEDADAALLSVLEDVLLSPDVIEEAIQQAVDQIKTSKNDIADHARAEVERLQSQLQRLTEAIAEGGEISSLVTAIRQREVAIPEALARLRAIESTPRRARTDAELTRKAESVVENWRDAFRKYPDKARPAVQAVLEGRLTLWPKREGAREFYEFEGVATLEPVLSGTLLPHNLASLGIPSWNQVESFLRSLSRLKELAGSAA